MNQYSPLSGLAEQDNDPSHWALGFCISNFLIESRPDGYRRAFEQLFKGTGYWSEDGWELCRWPHRYLGSDLEVNYSGDGFLAWTDPTDHGFQPSWRIYEETQFKGILKRCVERHVESVAGAKVHAAALMAALEEFL